MFNREYPVALNAFTPNDTVAAAHAAASRFDESVYTPHRAMALALSRGEAKLGTEVEARLKFCTAQQPFRGT